MLTNNKGSLLSGTFSWFSVIRNVFTVRRRQERFNYYSSPGTYSLFLVIRIVFTIPRHQNRFHYSPSSESFSLFLVIGNVFLFVSSSCLCNSNSFQNWTLIKLQFLTFFIYQIIWFLTSNLEFDVICDKIMYILVKSTNYNFKSLVWGRLNILEFKK